jgi:hypothetical protein
VGYGVNATFNNISVPSWQLIKKNNLRNIMF